MVNNYIQYSLRKVKKLNNYEILDINKSKKILFSLFTRYGDTIIDLVVIKEFIEKYPNKYYTILCPKQMVPYVNKLLPSVNVRGFNKRNIISFIKTILFLKKENFDLGFNPWSNGDDSCFWISFCKKFFCYKVFNRPKVINHYEVVRKYLNLDSQKINLKNFDLSTEYNKIIICPESTDEQRSLSVSDVEVLTQNLIKKYAKLNIIICALDEDYKLESCLFFKFKKTNKSSLEFLSLVSSSDLSICVDSGPLHLMMSLNIDTLAIFNITTPDIVLNYNSKLNIYNKKEILDDQIFL